MGPAPSNAERFVSTKAELRAVQSGPLYKSEPKIYPREIKGLFTTLRRLSTVVLLGIFYLVPWLQWEGRQAVLFDMPARKFYIFGLTLWPQDFIYLALLLIIAGISLFFFTALGGRLWCGFACPQTIWTEAFTWMERLTEGNRSQRMKLDKAPWSLTKFGKKFAKQFCWIVFSLFTGFTFVGYFVPVHTLSSEIVTLNVGSWASFWVLFYGFATYGNAGYMREQVCKYMCPYARFQSSMFDRDTLIVTYDGRRGEPRGGRRRGSNPQEQGLGDCIDCTLCVQVCPTGIDIRDGLQYECIACAACIDACDQVMDKMNYPRGLVRYSTQHALENSSSRAVRPRTLIYAALLLTLIVVFAASLAMRNPLILDVIRDRNTLYRDVGLRGIENSYTVRMVNKDSDPHMFMLSVDGVDGIEIASNVDFRIEAQSISTLPISVIAPHENSYGGHRIEFTLKTTDGSDISVTEESRFRGPAKEN